MPLRRVLALLFPLSLLLAACGDDDGELDTDTEAQEEAAEGDTEPVFEADASMGEPVTYRGNVETEDEWEVTVTVEEVECDVDIEVAAEDERHCVARLSVENTGEVEPLEEFWESSTLQTDDEGSYLASVSATDEYTDEQGVEPMAVLAPGESGEQYLVFAVPDDSEPTYLHLLARADDQVLIIDLTS